MMTNLTLLELAVIAVALDWDEGAERKRRRWAVHPAWSKREFEGEFVTLYKEMIDDEVKIYGYFWMNRECFSALLEKVSPLLIPGGAEPTNTFQIWIQGGANMTGTDLYVNKPHCAAAVRPWESEAKTSTLPPARVRTSSVLSGSC